MLPAIAHLSARLRPLGWVTDLHVGGSVATGDYRSGVSDLDLVALVEAPIDPVRRSPITAIHRDLDATVAAGARLGCVYVDRSRLCEPAAVHPTWTHGAGGAGRLLGSRRPSPVVVAGSFDRRPRSHVDGAWPLRVGAR